MTDFLSPSERSKRMSLIRNKDTKPEILVRRMIHKMGYRYRLHSNKLPGKPDLIFPARKKVIFVHGCFWHQHNPCNQYRQPKTKKEFWLTKLNANKRRDTKNRKLLKSLGWEYLIVWECALKNTNQVAKKIIKFLET